MVVRLRIAAQGVLNTLGTAIQTTIRSPQKLETNKDSTALVVSANGAAKAQQANQRGA